MAAPRIGLNKGEAHHSLKRALFFNRLGEPRDRTREDQACRAAGLNLLAAAITYWNTLHLGAVVAALDAEGRRPSAETLAHVSPLAWEHITPTGDYRRHRPTDPPPDPSRTIPNSSANGPKSTLVAVVKTSRSSRLVAGIVPGLERHP